MNMRKNEEKYARFDNMLCNNMYRSLEASIIIESNSQLYQFIYKHLRNAAELNLAKS